METFLENIMSEPKEKEYMYKPDAKCTGLSTLHKLVLMSRKYPQLLTMYFDKYKWATSYSVNTTNQYGWTPLMMAVRHSNTWATEEAVKLILSQKPDVDMKNVHHKTALMIGSMYSTTDSTENTVKMLLDARADPNLVDDYGWTALTMALDYNDRPENTVRMLLEAGADINKKTVFIHALELAVVRRSHIGETVIKLILENMVSIRETNSLKKYLEYGGSNPELLKLWMDKINEDLPMILNFKEIRHLYRVIISEQQRLLSTLYGKGKELDAIILEYL